MCIGGDCVPGSWKVHEQAKELIDALRPVSRGKTGGLLDDGPPRAGGRQQGNVRLRAPSGQQGAYDLPETVDVGGRRNLVGVIGQLWRSEALGPEAGAGAGAARVACLSTWPSPQTPVADGPPALQQEKIPRLDVPVDPPLIMRAP